MKKRFTEAQIVGISTIRTLMSAQDFKRGLQQALRTNGFVPYGNVLRRDGSDVAILVDFEHSFGQWYIVAGFWILHLGRDVPHDIIECHLRFRIERLVPEHREVILAAGAVGDPQQSQSYRELLSLLEEDIDASLRSLTSVEALRRALLDGRLSHGLIKKEARAYLLAKGLPVEH